MRRTFGVVACAVSLCACFDITSALLGCEPPPSVPRWDIVIGPVSGDVAAVAVGDALQLSAEVRQLVGGVPDMERGACHGRYGDPVAAIIVWSSSDERIATVSATGLVRGQATGNAIITAQPLFRNVSTSLLVSVAARATAGP